MQRGLSARIVTKTVYVTQTVCDVIVAGPHASEP